MKYTVLSLLLLILISCSAEETEIVNTNEDEINTMAEDPGSTNETTEDESGATDETMEEGSGSTDENEFPNKKTFSDYSEEVIFFKDGKISEMDAESLEDFERGTRSLLNDLKEVYEKVYFTFLDDETLETNIFSKDPKTVKYYIQDSILYINNTETFQIFAKTNDSGEIILKIGMLTISSSHSGGAYSSGGETFYYTTENFDVFPLSFESTKDSHNFNSIEDISNDGNVEKKMVLTTLNYTFTKQANKNLE